MLEVQSVFYRPRERYWQGFGATVNNPSISRGGDRNTSDDLLRRVHDPAQVRVASISVHSGHESGGKLLRSQ